MINTNSHSMKFKKGNIPWNTGIRINLDLDFIKKEHWNKERSIVEIAKELGVSDRLIRIRMKENDSSIRNNKPTQRTKQKISNTNKIKGIQPLKRFSGRVWNKGLTINDARVKENIKGLMKARKTQVTPVKDTTIEIKMQNFLTQLGINFFTHQYIKEIEHGYQCDILIPVQEGINQKTIIECFGTYWHNYPTGRKLDTKRCEELRKSGWRVIVLWENEIKVMRLLDLENKIIGGQN